MTWLERRHFSVINHSRDHVADDMAEISGASARHSPAPVNHTDADPAEKSYRTSVAARAEANRFRNRLGQLADPGKILSGPALQFDKDWEIATPSIASEWILNHRKHNDEHISHVNAASAKALEYERRHRKGPDAIPEEDRLLKNASKQDYYDASIEAFLRSVGETNPQEVIASFKLAATGNLHRQLPTVGTASSYAVTGANALFNSATASAIPGAGLGFSVARLVTQTATAAAVVDSGYTKMRNTGTEEVVQEGRSDAAQRAKEAPDLLHSSVNVIKDLPSAEKNVRKLKLAMEALVRARSGERLGTVSHEEAERCQENYSMLLGRICHQLATKYDHKAASESAKVELRGNLRSLVTNYMTSFFSISVGSIAILAPLLIDFSVTGGLTTAAAVLTMGVYLGYQLSKAPSEDSGDKGKRAIVALVKLLEILDGEKTDLVKSWGDAWAEMHAVRKKSRYYLPARKAQVREVARQAYLERSTDILEKNSPDDPLNPKLTAKQNYENYKVYHRRLESLKQDLEAGTLSRQHFDEAVAIEDQLFKDRYAKKMNMKEAVSAWKTPIDMRMQAAERILRGKLALQQKRLQTLRRQQATRRWETPMQTARTAQRTEELETELARCLIDLGNFELAMASMVKVAVQKDTPPESVSAASQLELIEDQDVRDLFCGDSRKQVEAMRLSKDLTAGEVERYTLTNLGFSVLGIGLNVGVQTADMGVNIDKVSGNYHGPKVLDFKLGTLPNTGQQYGQHTSSGDRNAVRQRDLRPLQRTLEDGMTPEEVRMHLGSRHRKGLNPDHPEVRSEARRIVAMMRHTDNVPTQFAISFHNSPATSPVPEQEPTKLDKKNKQKPPGDFSVTSKLDKTTAFHRALYNKASQQQKRQVNLHKAGIVMRQAAMSVAVLPVQWVASGVLNKTRPAMYEADDLVSHAFDVLHQNSGPAAPPAVAEPVPVPPRARTRPAWGERLSMTAGRKSRSHGKENTDIEMTRLLGNTATDRPFKDASDILLEANQKRVRLAKARRMAAAGSSTPSGNQDDDEAPMFNQAAERGMTFI